MVFDRQDGLSTCACRLLFSRTKLDILISHFAADHTAAISHFLCVGQKPDYQQGCLSTNGRSVCLVTICCIAFSVKADEVDERRLRIDPTKHHLEIDSYSTDTGASKDIAIAEMDRQLLAQDGIDALRREFEGRLAGLYWTCYPSQAINVRLTGATSVAPRNIETAAGDVPVLFTIGAPMTAVEQRRRLRESWSALKMMVPGLIGAGVDERDGVVLIDARSPDGDPGPYDSEKSNIERVLGIPVRFSVINAMKEREINQPAETLQVRHKDAVRRPDRHQLAYQAARSWTAAPNNVQVNLRLVIRAQRSGAC